MKGWKGKIKEGFCGVLYVLRLPLQAGQAAASEQTMNLRVGSAWPPGSLPVEKAWKRLGMWFLALMFGLMLLFGLTGFFEAALLLPWLMR